MEIKKIGWIGTGVMGKSMCTRIIQSGFKVSAYNRTKDAAADLIETGATWCNSPAEVAEKSEVVFSIVGFPADVEEVVFGDDGILSRPSECSIIVDMTTSEPKLAKKIYERAKEQGISSLDAPVSGGDVGAREGRLAIMVGGDRDTYKQILPLFEILGENIAYMGEAGAGQHTKMSNQILIASTMIGVIESLLYAYKAGIDMDEVIDVIGKGAASSWSINNLGRRIAKGDFGPGFFIKHFIKDMGIALEEAKRMNLSLPGLAAAHQFYLSAASLGYENLGTQGLFKVFQQMNNIGTI